MNSINIIGRMTSDPELRKTQSGTSCCSFTLAVKRPKVKDVTDFHNFVVWQQGAEYLCQYGRKGDIVGVAGYLTTREWTDKDDNKRKSVEVVCDSVELLSSKRNSETGNTTTNRQTFQQSQPSYAQQGFQSVNIPDSELPF